MCINHQGVLSQSIEHSHALLVSCEGVVTRLSEQDGWKINSYSGEALMIVKKGKMVVCHRPVSLHSLCAPSIRSLHALHTPPHEHTSHVTPNQAVNLFSFSFPFPCEPTSP